jgi:hypothetical protein
MGVRTGQQSMKATASEGIAQQGEGGSRGCLCVLTRYSVVVIAGDPRWAGIGNKADWLVGPKRQVRGVEATV